MTLTDRYIAATLARTPARQRDDIAADLRSAIADSIDARLDSGEFDAETNPAQAAEVAVLNEMGDPERLAADYSDRALYLIGPRLFLQWKRLTVLLLWIVVPIVAVAVGLAALLGDNSGWNALGAALGAAWTTAIMIGFWVTAVFAVLDRASQKEIDSMTTPWSVERLPEAPQARVQWSDTVGAAVTLVVSGALLVWQQAAPWVSDGTGVPVINPDLWSFVLPALLAVMAIELVTVIMRQVRGHWTMADWWGCLALNVAGVALLAPSLLGGYFLNDEFFAQVGWPDAAAPVTLDGLQVLVWGTLVVIAVVDVVAGLRKARRAIPSRA